MRNLSALHFGYIGDVTIMIFNINVIPAGYRPRGYLLKFSRLSPNHGAEMGVDSRL